MSTTSPQKSSSPLPEEEEEEWELVPPDGGRGWFILGGTLLINMLIPGTIKSFGVLFVEFIEVFQVTPLVASWIPALCYFLYCSIGPLTTYLSIKTSYRTVTIAGGLFAAFGMILSCFATSIVYLYFSFGIMVGIGAGLSFPPGIYLVTSYFLKYRGLANGIAISGSAMGSIIFPPFLRFLLQLYGYRGAVLIMGGLTFNVIVGALFYDPVSKHMKKRRVVKEVTNGEVGVGMVTKSHPTTEKTAALDMSPTVVTEEKEREGIFIMRGTGGGVVGRGGEDTEVPLLSQSMGTRKISAPAFKKSDSGRKVSSASFGGRLMGSTGQIGRKTSGIGSPLTVGSTGHMSRNYSVASNMSSSSLRYVSTAFHGSTLVGLHPEFSSNVNVRAPPPPAKRWLCCGGESDKDKKNKKEDSHLMKLLKNPIYIIILISNASNAIGYVNFTILVPSYAQSIGFDKDKASYLLSIIACTDLIGRVGGASLSDIIKIDKKYYYVGGFLVSGIALAALPLVSSYKLVGTLCAVFGLASGTYVGITAVIMAEILGEEMLASSYGISLFVNGVLQLVGPPICGLIFQQISSYGPIVSGLGLVLVLGAAVWLLLPFIKNKAK